ncbi:MAG: hypothetical protein GC158_02275 [Cyanobacteria bacterium RI_101]|nr:hypothetical protein [Cyanobacteria bacterium RI_101]
MTSLRELQTEQILALLQSYRFDLKGRSPLALLEKWREQFSPDWISLAVIEALYQGRYKAVSVEHLLAQWRERGRAAVHFSADFERLVAENLPAPVCSRELETIEPEPVAEPETPPLIPRHPGQAIRAFSPSALDSALGLKLRQLARLGSGAPEAVLE